MPNGIKYSTGATEAGCLRKGNMLISNNTADTGNAFYTGINPPAGGYTIYLNKASGGPSIYCPANDTQLISITNQIAGASYTTAAQCLAYFATQTDKIVVNFNYEGIVTNGLVLNLDAGFRPSYSSTGTTWYDLSGNTNNGTLINGPTFNSANSGSIVFDGIDDYVTTPTNIISSLSDFTVELIIKYNTSNPIYGGVFGYGKPPDNNANFGFMLHAQSNGFYALLSDGTNRSFGAAVNTLQNNTIYNILFTFKSDGNTSSYINGSLISSVSPDVGWFTTIKVDPSFFVALGIDVRYIGGTGNRHFLGSIYNCKLYNRILNSSEITQNYNAQKGRFGI